MSHSGTQLFCGLILSVICLSLVSGYVLNHNQQRGLRGRQRGSTTSRVPVKTNEEQEEEDGWEVDSHRTEHSRNEPMAEHSETHGNEHWSTMFDRFFPSDYHSHVQLGPGLSFNVSSGINFDGNSNRLWWKGPNVCVSIDEKEDDDDDDDDERRRGRRIFHHRLLITHSCDDTESVRKCTTVRSSNGKTKITTKTFECCAGFAKEEDQQYCTEEVERVDLISTMEQLSATETVRALALSGLTNIIQSANYTVFAPTNQAFDRYHRPETERNVVVINEEVERLAEGLNRAMTSHILPGFIKTSSVEDEQLIETENPDAKIRINKYNVRGRSNQLITANCVPISRANVKATNGIIHQVDSVLQPVTRDIKSIVRADPRLSIMSTVLEHIDLEEYGHYTLLAPTDQAFQKLSPAIRDKILHGQTCGKDVIKQHILPNVICTTVIDGRVRTRNVLNNYVHMSRDDDDFLVETSRVVQRDVMATNGVIQVLDDVILPSTAVDVLEAIEKIGATKFLELLRATNLGRELQEMTNYTLFVPSNQALEETGKLNSEESRGQDDVSRLLAGHVISGVVRGRHLYHGRQLNSSHQSDIYSVQSYQSFPMSRQSVKSVQCAPISHADIDTCDAVIHVVNKLIIPSSDDMLNLLQKNSTFSDLFELIRSTDLTQFLSNTNHHFTMFAPTNQAFRTLPGFLDELRNDTTKARRLVLSHMLPDIRCCSGVFASQLFMSYEQNMDGWMISVDRTQRPDRVRYGSVPVVSCDLMASNGVLHAIDSFSPSVTRRYNTRNSRRGGGGSGGGGGGGGGRGFRFSLDDLWSVFD